jgi:hypothetical protein
MWEEPTQIKIPSRNKLRGEGSKGMPVIIRYRIFVFRFTIQN